MIILRKYGLLTKSEVKMAGYWTETNSGSMNSQKNEVNIQQQQ